MVDFLEGMVRSMCRLALPSAGCGKTLNSYAEKLDRMKQEVVRMDCIPYSRPRAGQLRWDNSHTETEPGIAAEFDFPDAVRDFDPGPYLSASSRRAFEDPDTSLLPQELQQEVPPVAGTTSRGELSMRWRSGISLCTRLSTALAILTR